jgi:hypothetical protein
MKAYIHTKEYYAARRKNDLLTNTTRQPALNATKNNDAE